MLAWYILVMDIHLTPEIISLGFTIFGAILTGVFVAGGLFMRIKRNEKDIASVTQALESHNTKSSDELKAISSKLDQLIGRVSTLFNDTLSDVLAVSKSPKQLSEIGQKVLKDSAVDKILDPMFDDIVEMVRAKKPDNPYQAQEALFEVVLSLGDNSGITDAIENGAFVSGYTPPEVLYVGALNMRDRVLVELGLHVEEIDKHDPAVKESK